MYRERAHMFVRGLDGWNEVVAVVNDVNAFAEQQGHPTAVLWTETVGVYDHLVAETEYDNLASFEASTKAMYQHPDFARYNARLTAVLVEGKGYTELLELATSLGDH
jgi:hypothetical protein